MFLFTRALACSLARLAALKRERYSGVAADRENFATSARRGFLWDGCESCLLVLGAGIRALATRRSRDAAVAVALAWFSRWVFCAYAVSPSLVVVASWVLEMSLPAFSRLSLLLETQGWCFFLDFGPSSYMAW